MNEFTEGVLMDEWRNQSLPRSKERARPVSYPTPSPSPDADIIHRLTDRLADQARAQTATALSALLDATLSNLSSPPWLGLLATQGEVTIGGWPHPMLMIERQHAVVAADTEAEFWEIAGRLARRCGAGEVYMMRTGGEWAAPVAELPVLLGREGVTESAAQCDHGVTFDPEAARNLAAAEVQRRWPRLFGPCPKGCGYVGIAYASHWHYVAGDW